MPAADPSTLDQAALWLVRTRDPNFSDWAGFTAWLEADTGHNSAYEALLDTDEAAGALTRAPAPLPVVMPDPSGRCVWRRVLPGMAVAAIAIAGAVTLMPRHDFYTVTTAAGEQRELTLADGTVISVNGDTSLTLDRGQPRQARLDRGEARFEVVHDPEDPFTVVSGTSVLRDAGTVFNVLRTASATEVAVAEGQVVFDPEGAAVRLTRGRTLYDRDRGVTEIGDVDPSTIGVWRSGRLSYHGAPLGRVASDLSRMTGTPVGLSPGLAERPFTGTILVRGVEQPALFSRVATMLGVRAVRDGHGWRLTTGTGAEG